MAHTSQARATRAARGGATTTQSARTVSAAAESSRASLGSLLMGLGEGLLLPRLRRLGAGERVGTSLSLLASFSDEEEEEDSVVGEGMCSVEGRRSVPIKASRASMALSGVPFNIYVYVCGGRWRGVVICSVGYGQVNSIPIPIPIQLPLPLRLLTSPWPIIPSSLSSSSLVEESASVPQRCSSRRRASSRADTRRAGLAVVDAWCVYVCVCLWG